MVLRILIRYIGKLPMFEMLESNYYISEEKQQNRFRGWQFERRKEQKIEHLQNIFNVFIHKTNERYVKTSFKTESKSAILFIVCISISSWAF